MDKREFLKNVGFVSLGLAILPLYQCQSNNQGSDQGNEDEHDHHDDIDNDTYFTLPALGFAYTALEPAIDAKTMEIHHSKHHGGYVKKLNTAVAQSDYQNKSLLEIIQHVSDKEEDNDIRNNAGGHFNHTLFWEILLPGGSTQPESELLNQINNDFGSFEDFKIQFSKLASEVFGSGWAWLCVDENKKLFIMNTENQDNPLMKKIVKKTGTPILGIDVWEHAYYLNYQNDRKEYIANFMKVINWDVVGRKFEKIIR